MNTEKIKEYFSENIKRKIAALVLLFAFSFNMAAEIVPDPVSISNARATRTASGIDQLGISTPNAKGMSYNSLKELQVSEQGLILNNSRHIVVNRPINNKNKNEIRLDAWLNGGKGKIEEYRTVGLGYKIKEEALQGPHKSDLGYYNMQSDIAENILRKEHGKKLRASYTCDSDWC